MTRRGKEISDLIYSKNLIILNNGLPTHFSPSYNTFSCIDVSLSSSSIATKFNWSTHDDLHGSDHYPISINLLTKQIERKKRPKWKLNDGNWTLFNTLSTVNCTNILDTSIDESVTKFSNLITQSASESIPKTTSKSKRTPVPWWTSEIHDAIKSRRKALKIFSKSPNTTNLVLFKKLRAKARFLIKQSCRITWENYVKSISIHTSVVDVFNKIKRISGVSSYCGEPILIVNNKIYSSPEEVANLIGLFFSKTKFN